MLRGFFAFGDFMSGVIRKIDVVNACLASLGESPAESIDEDNPFIASAISSLNRVNASQQGRGWWYNWDRVYITPNAQGWYAVSADVLGLRTGINPPWMSLRGRRIYDNRNAKFFSADDYNSKNLLCWITRLVEFDDCPFHMQDMIQWATVLDFQSNYDCDDQKIALAQNGYEKAEIEINREHTRAVRQNALTTGPGGAMMNRIRILRPVCE
jgi:hypothetical protein